MCAHVHICSCHDLQSCGLAGTDVTSAFYNFSRFLIKNVEHDWGYHAGFNSDWSNAELKQNLSICHTNMTSDRDGMCQSRMSWIDQRTWGIDFPLQALRVGNHSLLKDVEKELAETIARRPEPEKAGLEPVPREQWHQARSMCGGQVSARVDQSGALDYLQTKSGEAYASPDHLLAEPVVHVSAPAQRRAWAAAYMTDAKAAPMFFKTADPFGDGIGYRPNMTALWSGPEALLVKSSLPPHVVRSYGGAEEMWQEFRFANEGGKGDAGGDSGSCSIAVTLLAFNKTATRITESWWMRFNPKPNRFVVPSEMRLDKLGSLVAPLDVVFNGSKTLHAISSGVLYGKSLDDQSAFFVGSADAPVVKVGAGNASLAAEALLGLNPAPVPNDRPPDLNGGIAFNLFNNLWNTNGIEWYPYDDVGKNMKFRFTLRIPLQ